MLLIAIALRDVFDVLFHPEGHAMLSRGIARACWRCFRVLFGARERVLSLAGPLALIAIITTWVVLLVLGWALIFWPHLDSGFEATAGGDGFLDAVYVSLVSLSTLGFGDITPVDTWLRIITPLEAMLGFGLLTSSISWLLTLYPALSRRRSLAYEIRLLSETEEDTGTQVPELDPDSAERLYAELTSRLVAVERDLVTFPVSYYFREPDERFSLAAMAGYLHDLAERGRAEGVPEQVRFRATMLAEAIRDFAETTSTRFHGDAADTAREVLEGYKRDQLRG